MMKFYTSVAFALWASVVVNECAAKEEELEIQAKGGMSYFPRKLAGIKNLPVQTFYVPFTEQFLFDEIFFTMRPDISKPPIESIVSLSISTDKTVVWWDHWEDGYDLNVVEGTGASTQIWGDGDASNGCAPDVKVCINDNDYLMAGRSIVIQNTVAIPRVKDVRRFDGGDMIQASYPIAVTRAAFPQTPGSVMAGAVEVLDTTLWGKVYEAPVGMNTGKTFEAFEITGLHVMANENNTVVTFPNGTIWMLQQGEGVMARVNQADKLVASKPVQVDLMTFDLRSLFEVRWFSLRPTNALSDSYVSPVGDERGKTKVVIYNPNTSPMTFTLQYLLNGTKMQYSQNVMPKQSAQSIVIPMGSGARVDGTKPFVALSYTDTEWQNGAVGNMEAFRTNGDLYDWGFPLVPSDELTSQVLIGFGYACTNNNCTGAIDRSVVWLTPMEDADVYVDYSNTGYNQRKISVRALESVKITDEDQDMSGSLIFAVKKDGPKYGAPVDIAVAWGQDPLVSDDLQPISMDLGTVVLPLPLIKVTKLVDKVVVTPGEEMVYTIRIANVGQKRMESDLVTIKDTLDSDVTYIANSASYSSNSGLTDKIPDSVGGTPFPLDESGFAIPIALFRRGGAVDITFKVKLSLSTKKSKIINTGILTQPFYPELPFDATSVVEYGANVQIENTVYLGSGDAGAKCGSAHAVEYLADYIGTNVTYCFVVTNIGKSHLGSIRISNSELNYTTTLTGVVLAPKQSTTVFTNQRITSSLTNNAVVLADPFFSGGSPIPDTEDVTATDPSAVGALQLKPNINIVNRVYVGSDNGALCATNQTLKKATDFPYSNVTYCFSVTNIGDTHLTSIVVENKELNFSRPIRGILAPNASSNFSVPGVLIEDLENIAVVTGIPVFSNGGAIPGLVDPVLSADNSFVSPLVVTPRIRITNVVYPGRNGGKDCGNATVASEYVGGNLNTAVTYCFRVINNDQVPLRNFTLTVPELNFTYRNATTVLPSMTSSFLVFLETNITSSIKNMATVTAIGHYPSGRRLPGPSAEVTASDPSEVGLLPTGVRALVKLDNTVYIGQDAARQCGTSAAKEYVEGVAGTPVTYCFLIKNIGTTHLRNLVIANTALWSGNISLSPILAPGASVNYPLQTAFIASNLTNTATVVARPCDSAGTRLAALADVVDRDPSAVGVLAYRPAVRITNTVYKGFNEYRFCSQAVEREEGYYGTGVMYCFNFTNTGNTWLTNFRLTDPKLNYSEVVSQTIAPGSSILVNIAGDILESLENEVTVTATPCRSNSTSWNIGDVSHSDPSSVGLIAYNPRISINNTVYIGVPGSCDKAVESVTDIYLTDVVYCLKVTNTGNSYLDNVTIVDSELNFTQTISRIMYPADSELIAVPGQIARDLVNTAVVQANPVLRDGTDIPGVNDVTSSDPSQVKMLRFNASIDITNTVYLGHDGGKSCASAVESVKDYFGSNVTFCFKITNTGETHLRSISLIDGVLQYFEILNTTLAPKASLTITVPKAIFESKTNIVNVTALPTTKEGRDLNLGEVKASDPSGVEMLNYSPRIGIANTVYLGVDGGKSCAKAVETVQDRYGAKVTYCLNVTNTGDTYLRNIELVDDVLKFNDTSINMIAPGAWVLVPVPDKITGNVTNVAVVSATPCIADGTDIFKQGRINASDPSSVLEVAHKPSINIENTVYIGSNDGGAKCASAVEMVKDFQDTPVMYCFEVMNSGDSYLKDVVIKDADLTYEDKSIKLLAPGEKRIISVPGSITKNFNNTAIAIGVPSLEDGTAIPNANPVQDSDPSGVEVKPYNAKILIENTVYLGHDDGKSCGTGRDIVQGRYETKVTYCFAVTNTGDATLADVEVVNSVLGFTKKLTGPLAPGATTILHLEKTILQDLENLAVVTGNPVTKDLKDIPGLSDVTSQDPSAVDMFGDSAGISIQNTVYLGNEDNGAQCGTDAAVELVSGTYATAVTYCFTIINTGNTYLGSITLVNGPLSFTSSAFSLLAPGANVTVSLKGTILDDLLNLAVATGNPVTKEGNDIPGLDNVSSEDPSEVKKEATDASVTIVNTVYKGNDGGKLCGTEDGNFEVVTDYFGTDVTYCFEITNTGSSYLELVVLNKELSIVGISLGLMEPGGMKRIPVNGTIAKDLINYAVVVGRPSLADGTIIPKMDNVTASDPSGVQILASPASVAIDNKVYNGVYSADGCKTAEELVYNYVGGIVTYCFKVKNDGSTKLNQVNITNPLLSFRDESIGELDVGEEVLVAFTTNVTRKLINIATVIANPITDSGIDIPTPDTVTASDPSGVDLLSYKPSIAVDNKVYVGDDNGAQCDVSAVEKVVDKNGTKVVYCFKVTNTGDTHLSSVTLVDSELYFTDGSISLLAPRESKMIAFASNITGNLTNNVVATGTPAMANGGAIFQAQPVTATDPSAVEVTPVNQTDKNTTVPPYVPPGPPEKCIQDKWKASGKNTSLVCATKQVYLQSGSLLSDRNLTCKVGEKITVTVNATIRVEGPRNDLGWYVATDGGDAMNGVCVVNGLQETSSYNMSAGSVVWTTTQGGDSDECGDIVTRGAPVADVRIPFIVNTTLTCADDTNDGFLDVAVCFTWRSADNNGECKFSTNIPGAPTGGCYCTRYDIPNIPAIPEKPVKPC